MEKNIFKKYNSLDLIKKIVFFLLKINLIKNYQIIFKKYLKIPIIFKNNFFLIYNGYKFIKLFILYFFIGLNIGQFIINKKPNCHISLKKLKIKKR